MLISLCLNNGAAMDGIPRGGGAAPPAGGAELPTSVQIGLKISFDLPGDNNSTQIGGSGG